MLGPGGLLHIRTNEGAGFADLGMNAVKKNEFVPHLPPYSQRMRLRTALPSIMSRSGQTAVNARCGGLSTGRLPYTCERKKLLTAGLTSFSHCAAVAARPPPGSARKSGTLPGDRAPADIATAAAINGRRFAIVFFMADSSISDALPYGKRLGGLGDNKAMDCHKTVGANHRRA